MDLTADVVKREIQARYGAAARSVSGREVQTAGCCGGTCGAGGSDPVTAQLYSDDERGALPAEAIQASLGCGNPTALAELQEGDTVLDLGSGGGVDVLLSSRRVGSTGRVYGLDMTDDMLLLARENQRKAGVTNVEFLKGEIEDIPLPDGSVDVIISNCVINLSSDKDQVFREAFRVLKPGGRLAVSDIVARQSVPDRVRRDIERWIGCVAGALDERAYRDKLAAAGFVEVDIDLWRTYDFADASGSFASAFVRALKPR